MQHLSQEQIQELAGKWLNGTITAGELELFEQWYNRQPPESIEWLKDEEEPVLKERIYNAIAREMPAARIVPFYGGRNKWWRIAAAAIIVTLGTGSFWWINHHLAKPSMASMAPSERFKNDLPPGNNKATLTLGDGSVIVLDSTASGTVAQQGNTRIINFNTGQLTYNTGSNTGNAVYYNTISTAVGNQYQLILPDGSKVWLNAASSLRFPTAFNDTVRKVELTGEGYFEVASLLISSKPSNRGAKDGGHGKVPFIVKMITPSGKEGQVEVLGTHFNINAYDDESTINTTLLEGSVRVSGRRTPDSRLLKPGQQAQLDNNTGIKIITNADTETAVAWKNNRFYFRSASIQTIMRQVARWYDVEVVYNAHVEERFNAEIPRNTYASDLLKALELTGKVKFSIEGNKIFVTK